MLFKRKNMKSFLISISFLLASMVVQAQQAIPYYGQAKTQAHEQMLVRMKEGKQAERLAATANVIVRLSKNLGVGFESCGVVNAYFEPSRNRIVICLEFIDLIREHTQKLDANSRAAVMSDIIWGLYFHELAHAVIGINNVPFTGREEDVADQFATFLEIEIEKRGVSNRNVTSTVWFWQQLAKDDRRHNMADEHSLSGVRAYNVACWALGANSKFGLQASNLIKLPDERRVRCPSEYARLSTGVKSIFSRSLKI